MTTPIRRYTVQPPRPLLHSVAHPVRRKPLSNPTRVATMANVQFGTPDKGKSKNPQSLAKMQQLFMTNPFWSVHRSHGTSARAPDSPPALSSSRSLLLNEQEARSCAAEVIPCVSVNNPWRNLQSGPKKHRRPHENTYENEDYDYGDHRRDRNAFSP